jgi:hypothetical protein
MSLLHTDLLGFPHDASLAYMLILNIEEVDLMRLFSNQPISCVSCVISLSFGSIANVKRIKASIQILHLIIYIFEIFYKILVINSIVFYCVKNFLDVPVKRTKRANCGLYIHAILKMFDILIEPDDVRHDQLFLRTFLL